MGLTFLMPCARLQKMFHKTNVPIQILDLFLLAFHAISHFKISSVLIEDTGGSLDRTARRVC